MKKQQYKMCQCNECGEYFGQKVLGIIDVVNEPNKRKDFLIGDIYTVECPFCHEKQSELQKTVIIDRNHKFVLVAGSIEDCFNAFEDENKKEYEKHIKKYDENDSLDKYTLFSSSIYGEAITSLVALENNMDIKLINVYVDEYIDCVGEKNNIDMEKAEVTAVLCYNPDNEILICCDVRINGEEQEYICPFGKAEYEDLCNTDYPYLDRTYPYYFSLESARKYRSRNLAKVDEMEKIFMKVAIVSIDQCQVFAKFIDYSETEYQEGDTIIILHNRKFVKGEILKIMEFNIFESPINIHEQEEIFWKYEDVEMITSHDSNDIIDNSSLHHDKDGDIPYTELQDCDVIIGSQFSTSIMFSDSMFESFDESEDKIVNIESKIYTKTIGDKVYICAYLSQDSFPKKEELSKMIYKFDDVAKMSVMNCNAFDGIVLIDGDKEHIFSNERITIAYMPDKIMTDEIKMREFLLELSEERKQFLEQPMYDFILKIYSEEIELSEFRKKYNLSEEELDEILTIGYRRIKQIIVSTAFNKDSEK